MIAPVRYRYPETAGRRPDGKQLNTHTTRRSRRVGGAETAHVEENDSVAHCRSDRGKNAVECVTMMRQSAAATYSSVLEQA